MTSKPESMSPHWSFREEKHSFYCPLLDQFILKMNKFFHIGKASYSGETNKTYSVHGPGLRVEVETLDRSGFTDWLFPWVAMWSLSGFQYSPLWMEGNNACLTGDEN